MVIEGNPVLSRRYRGGELESLHRGCWAIVAADGRVLAGAGDPDQLVFARSASKSLQACGVLTLDAVDTAQLSDQHIAVMVSSHNGEAEHVEAVESLLALSQIDETALRCGEATPMGDPQRAPRRIYHNCSGKHAGFLTGAVALGQEVETYLDPGAAVQQAVRDAVSALTEADGDDLTVAIDGCSAPTFAMPLRNLGQGIARVAAPSRLDSTWSATCSRIVASVAAHPSLVAGRHPARFDTALIEASNGALFSKGGADGVQVVGVVESGLAFVGKIDDGNARGLYPVVGEVLRQLGLLSEDASKRLSSFISPEILNADGLTVGQQVIEHLDVAGLAPA